MERRPHPWGEQIPAITLLEMTSELFSDPAWTLPLERMCKDGPDTPLAAPLHPAAEAFWR